MDSRATFPLSHSCADDFSLHDGVCDPGRAAPFNRDHPPLPTEVAVVQFSNDCRLEIRPAPSSSAPHHEPAAEHGVEWVGVWEVREGGAGD